MMRDIVSVTESTLVNIIFLVILLHPKTKIRKCTNVFNILLLNIHLGLSYTFV